MRKAIRTILEFGIYIAIIAGIVWGVPNFLSWKLQTKYPIAAITSGSMWPVLQTGDLVLIQNVPKNELQIGDVVVWKNTNGFTIHRIVKLNELTLVTKGDANFSEDVPVSYDDVIGKNLMWGKKPVRLPYLGYISIWGAHIKQVYAEK